MLKPWECKVFGTACTPETPIGTCMVSPEGACAAYYNFGRFSRQRVREAAGSAAMTEPGRLRLDRRHAREHDHAQRPENPDGRPQLPVTDREQQVLDRIGRARRPAPGSRKSGSPSRTAPAVKRRSR